MFIEHASLAISPPLQAVTGACMHTARSGKTRGGQCVGSALTFVNCSPAQPAHGAQQFKLLCIFENCDLLSCNESEPFLRPNADDEFLFENIILIINLIHSQNRSCMSPECDVK